MAESRIKEFIRLEVNHESGTIHALLMLAVGLHQMHSFCRQPGSWFVPSTSREGDVGCLELCRLLGRGQCQYQRIHLSDSSLIDSNPRSRWLDDDVFFLPSLILYPPFSSRSTRCASFLVMNCQVTRTEGCCSTQYGDHVLCVVYHQSPWNRTCCKATRSGPRFRP